MSDDDDDEIEFEYSSNLSSGTDSSTSGANKVSFYVGDLDPSTTETMLFKHFTHCGRISSIRLCRDAATQKSLCYAYINFQNEQAGQKALEEWNFSLINGKQCRIVKAVNMEQVRQEKRNSNVYIRDLGAGIDSKQLMEIFSQFGRIISCKAVEPSDGHSPRRGYVQFEDERSAKQAVSQMNGTRIGMDENDSIAIVSQFIPKEDRERRKDRQGSLFIRGMPKDCTEDDIFREFKPYGEIESVYLSTPNAGDRKMRWGFVNYKSDVRSRIALMFMDGVVIQGNEQQHHHRNHHQRRSDKLHVSLSRKQKLNQIYSEESSCCVLIKGLGPSVTKAHLDLEIQQSTTICSTMTETAVPKPGQAWITTETHDDALSLLEHFQTIPSVSVALLPELVK